MIMWVLTALIYIFFIYGVIAFMKNLYLSASKKTGSKNLTIEVIVHDKYEVEYYIRILKNHFGRIILNSDDNLEDIEKAIEEIAGSTEIEYKTIENLKRTTNS